MNTTMEVMRMVDAMASADQRPGQAAVHGSEHHGADDAQRAGFGRGGEAHEDRAEHEEDQHDRGDHAQQHRA